MINLKYTGVPLDVSGFGEANRNDICALFSAGVNVTVESVRQMAEKTNYGIEEAICANLIDRDLNYKVKIIHLTPDLFPRYLENGVYHIGRTVHETSKLPDVWTTACNGMDELWVPSEQIADRYRKSGVKKPIYVFPEPIFTQKGEENIKQFETQYQKDFFFYSIFQWIPRKNPKTLLRAYWRAFEGNYKVTMVLKTYRINYSEGEFNLIREEIESFKRELNLKHYPKIYLVKRLLTEKEMWRLHQMGNCYVSSSSAEGWHRGLQESMLLGKPCISGNNGGLTDWLSGEHYYSVRSNPVPVTVMTQIPWYLPGQEWWEIEEEDLIKRMKEIYNDYETARKVGEKAKEFVKKEFSWQRVGETMKNRLEEIYKKL